MAPIWPQLTVVDLMGAEIRVGFSVEGDDVNLMPAVAGAIGDFERQAATARKNADPSFLRLHSALPGLMCLVALRPCRTAII